MNISFQAMATVELMRIAVRQIAYPILACCHSVWAKQSGQRDRVRWAIAFLCSSTLSACLPLTVQAQPRPVCTTDGSYEPAAETNRTIALPDFNIAVAIPANYRAMKLQDGAVQILHPADFEWLQCLARGGTGAHGYYSERIQQVQPHPTMSLPEQASWSVGYRVNPDGSRTPGATSLTPYQDNGLDGYIATSISGYSVVFLGTAPGSNLLLQISAGCDCEVDIEAVTDLLSRVQPLD